MPYEDVTDPPEVAEAFLRSDSTAAQAQAAALLSIGQQLSADPTSETDDEVMDYVGLPPLAPKRAGERIPADRSRDLLASRLSQVE